MIDPAALLPLPLQRLSSRLLALLPDVVIRQLAGKPTVLDGQTLHPEMGLALRLQSLVEGADWHELGPAGTRAQVRRQTLAAAVGQARIEGVRSLAVNAETTPLPARLYVPLNAPARGALLVFFHGGGHVFGDLDSYDPVCRLLAAESGARVLSVAYRLAPEHPFPAAADDATAAFRWAVANAEQLGADPDRVAVGGDSAGANLAAVVALDTRDARDAVRPVLQLLIYPVVDMTAATVSRALFADGFLLTERRIAWATGCYLPRTAQRSDPRASPMLADDLAGVAPAYVATAGFDPLRDEGEAYAQRLQEAGVDVELRRHEGLIHGFANLAGVSRAARAALVEAASALQRASLRAPSPR